jgi:hypothetical protein
MSPPSLGLLAAFFMLISCLAYSSILQLDTTYSSETLVDIQRTTRRHILKDITLHNHCRKNQTLHYQYCLNCCSCSILRAYLEVSLCPMGSNTKVQFLKLISVCLNHSTYHGDFSIPGYKTKGSVTCTMWA